MPKMTSDEIREFLDEPDHLVRIGTVDDDGFPRVLPLWFVRDGSRLLFTPRAPAVIWANIQRDRKIAVLVDEGEAPYRKVTVQGECAVVHQPGADDLWRDLYRVIAKRYTPGEFADAYVDGTDDQPRALSAIDMESSSSRVSSWRMPVSGEDPRGVWAARYYLPGTKWAIPGRAHRGS